MNGGARGVTCGGLLVLALVAGAQIPLTTNERDQELSPRSLAYRAKILAALDGIKICPNAKLYEDPSGKGKISISARVRSLMVVTERPAQPTEAEVIARSELILTRLGRRKGVDFEFVRASSLPDTEEWDPYLGISPTVGGQLVEFRRPAYRGFFDRDQEYIFEYNLVDDTLVRLEVPAYPEDLPRAKFAKVITAEEAAALASKVANEYQSRTRAVWARFDSSPAVLLKEVEPQWRRKEDTEDPDRRPSPHMNLSSWNQELGEREMLVPTYAFPFLRTTLVVRADTSEARLLFSDRRGELPWSSQLQGIGRKAPRLSEFFVLSTAAFWALILVFLVRAFSRPPARRETSKTHFRGGHPHV